MAKKIICLFDYKAKTGYGTVTRNIIPIIQQHFGSNLKMDIVAVNYFGDTDKNGKIVESSLIIKDEHKNTIYSAKLYDRANRPSPDDFGRDLFCKLCLNNDYDGIFVIQDVGVISAMMPVLQGVYSKKTHKPKSIAYFPIDADFYPKSLFAGLELFDRLVTYTNWGRKVILKSRPDLENKVSVIGHGINDKEFFPLPEVENIRFRKSYFGEENANKFIIGNINRNQPRKDIPTTILAFEEAKKSFSNSDKKIFLYLGMHPQDPLGNDLKFLLKQTSLVEGVDYMFPKKGDANYQVNLATLNRIYNALDCYVTTTLSGGWELPVMEAMATKTPVICPNHTSLTEICNFESSAGFLPTVEEYEKYRAISLDNLSRTVGADNIIRYKTSIESLSHRMEVLAKEDVANWYKQHSKEVVDNAYEYTQKMQWSEIAKEWLSLWQETFKINE